jgi:hypothetical protein
VHNRRHRRGRHAAPKRRRYGIVLASATCLVATGATGVLLTGSDTPAASADAPPAGPSLSVSGLDRTEGDRSGGDRAGGDEVSRAAARDRLSPTPAAPPVPRRPIAGLDQAQTDNAATIVDVARRHGLPERAMVVAVATAMQESDLRNVASTAVPGSLGYPHQGVEVDHDSVGLFQQRPSQGWGTVAQLMDPVYAAGVFFDRLARVPGWASMSVSGAAQAVQRSAFPGAYQKHQPLAEQVVAALA